MEIIAAIIKYFNVQLERTKNQNIIAWIWPVVIKFQMVVIKIKLDRLTIMAVPKGTTVLIQLLLLYHVPQVLMLNLTDITALKAWGVKLCLMVAGKHYLDRQAIINVH